MAEVEVGQQFRWGGGRKGSVVQDQVVWAMPFHSCTVGAPQLLGDPHDSNAEFNPDLPVGTPPPWPLDHIKYNNPFLASFQPRMEI